MRSTALHMPFGSQVGDASIEVLRGLAACLVMLTHYTHMVIPHAGLWGFASTGVDLFFVLSGYVFGPYLYGRSVRLVPPFHSPVLSHLSSLLAWHWVCTPVFAGGKDNQLHISSPTFSCSTLSSQSRWLPLTTWPFGVCRPNWSFISLFRFGLAGLPQHVLVHPTGRIRHKACSGSGSRRSRWSPHSQGPCHHSSPGLALRVHARCLGLEPCQNRLIDKPAQPALGRRFLYCNVAGTYGVHVADFGRNTPHPPQWLAGSMGLWAAVGYALLVSAVVGRPIGWATSHFAHVGIWLGHCSYGIYLMHNAVPQLLRAAGVHSSGWVLLFTCVITTLAMSWVLHLSVERPMRNWGRTLARRGL